MNHLLRESAPVSERAWQQVDEEARRQLTTCLGARKLVDFSGPFGWEHSASGFLSLDGIERQEGARLSAHSRRVLPLVELRSNFEVAREELTRTDRGASDPDLSDLGRAARALARAENAAVFHGWEAAGIVGIATMSPHDPIGLGDEPAQMPRQVARAVEALRSGGVEGPYGLALGPEQYTSVVETTEHGGILVFDHLRHILGGRIVWAPGVSGAVALSQRGGDFVLESGQDVSIGYESHDSGTVRLYLEESFTFRVHSPEAGIALPKS
ncbi:MAG: family 1 encapsulin nanocompartment shell protein [Acidimicrobiales bacterium]